MFKTSPLADSSSLICALRLLFAASLLGAPLVGGCGDAPLPTDGLCNGPCDVRKDEGDDDDDDDSTGDGDGDGDQSAGDGDGDESTGDGDSDEGTGDGDGDGDGDGVTAEPMTQGAPRIPVKPAQCPKIATGNITVMGQQVQLWVGKKQAGKKGPIMFYWHGTGSTPAEAQTALGTGNKEILDQGGVIASFSTTTKTGKNTGNNVWYTGDFEMADQILACAIEQQDVDPRRVYTGGCSAGGLQASAMVYGRSSYLAAAMPNSGGTVSSYTLEDPKHVPPVIATHGGAGKDVVFIDFSKTTTTFLKDLVAKGGFEVQCDHGGDHCRSPAEVKNAQWEFLKAHPFGVTPEPYAKALPASFPAACKIVAK